MQTAIESVLTSNNAQKENILPMRRKTQPFKRKLTLCKQYGGMLQMIQSCAPSMSQKLVLNHV